MLRIGHERSRNVALLHLRPPNPPKDPIWLVAPPRDQPLARDPSISPDLIGFSDPLREKPTVQLHPISSHFAPSRPASFRIVPLRQGVEARRTPQGGVSHSLASPPSKPATNGARYRAKQTSDFRFCGGMGGAGQTSERQPRQTGLARSSQLITISDPPTPPPPKVRPPLGKAGLVVSRELTGNSRTFFWKMGGFEGFAFRLGFLVSTPVRPIPSRFVSDRPGDGRASPWRATAGRVEGRAGEPHQRPGGRQPGGSRAGRSDGRARAWQRVEGPRAGRSEPHRVEPHQRGRRVEPHQPVEGRATGRASPAGRGRAVRGSRVRGSEGRGPGDRSRAGRATAWRSEGLAGRGATAGRATAGLRSEAHQRATGRGPGDGRSDRPQGGDRPGGRAVRPSRAAGRASLTSGRRSEGRGPGGSRLTSGSTAGRRSDGLATVRGPGGRATGRGASLTSGPTGGRAVRGPGDGPRAGRASDGSRGEPHQRADGRAGGRGRVEGPTAGRASLTSGRRSRLTLAGDGGRSDGPRAWRRSRLTLAGDGRATCRGSDGLAVRASPGRASPARATVRGSPAGDGSRAGRRAIGSATGGGRPGGRAVRPSRAAGRSEPHQRATVRGSRAGRVEPHQPVEGRATGEPHQPVEGGRSEQQRVVGGIGRATGRGATVRGPGGSRAGRVEPHQLVEGARRSEGGPRLTLAVEGLAVDGGRAVRGSRAGGRSEGRATGEAHQPGDGLTTGRGSDGLAVRASPALAGRGPGDGRGRAVQGRGPGGRSSPAGRRSDGGRIGHKIGHRGGASCWPVEPGPLVSPIPPCIGSDPIASHPGNCFHLYLLNDHLK
jgi:hypothetical protein